MEQRNWPRSHDELQGSPIQVRVASVEHIFNPMDPTPLEDRSLNIGVAAIFGFNGVAQVIGRSTNPFLEVLHEGLLVVGWVSMWKPMEIFLYEWWPIRRERRACRRLAEATVTFPAKPTR